MTFTLGDLLAWLGWLAGVAIIGAGVRNFWRSYLAQERRRQSQSNPSAGMESKSGQVFLRVRYPGSVALPATDIHVFLDNAEIGIGNGRSGIEISAPTTAGIHKLRFKAAAMGSHEFSVELGGAGTYEAHISSTWTGRFGCRVTRSEVFVPEGEP